MSHAKTGFMQNTKSQQMMNKPTCRMLIGLIRIAAINRKRGGLRGLKFANSFHKNLHFTVIKVIK